MSMAEDTRKRPDFSSDYSSSTPRESGSDPLAELARLIGQSDPFTDIVKDNPRKPFEAVRKDDRPAPEWLARPATPEHDDYDPPAPHQAYTQPAYPPAQPEPHAQASHGATGHHADAGDYPEDAGGYDHYPPDDRYRVSLPSGHEPDGYYAEDGHMPPPGEEGVSHRRRGTLLTVAAVVGLAVIGTAGAFGYRAFVSGGSAPTNPPVIKADPTPPKTVPAPSTTASVDSKPIQDRIGAMAAPERVVPREEQPVSLPTGPAPTPRATAPQPSAQAAAPLVSPPSPMSASNEPKKVKTVTIRQDNSGTDSAGMASAPAAAPPAQTRTPATKQSPMTIAPQSDPSSRTKTAARTPPAQAAGGAYVVQVSAQKTEDEARASFQVLQQKYPSVLSGRDPIIRRAELGQSGTWYRVHVGSFATSEQATALCNNLKDAGGQCIVQKN
ncbi:MAG: SPOR domain-containing protein [Xanthobacteraceae bacterium]